MLVFAMSSDEVLPVFSCDVGLGTDGGRAVGTSPSLGNIGGKVSLDGALALAPEASTLDLGVVVLNVPASEGACMGGRLGGGPPGAVFAPRFEAAGLGEDRGAK